MAVQLLGRKWGIPLIMFCYTIFIAVKKRKREALFLIGFVFINAVLHSGFIITGMTRYRIPIDSLVFIVSFYGFFEIVEKLIKTKSVPTA